MGRTPLPINDQAVEGVICGGGGVCGIRRGWRWMEMDGDGHSIDIEHRWTWIWMWMWMEMEMAKDWRFLFVEANVPGGQGVREA